jgi:hypothetical protein
MQAIVNMYVPIVLLHILYLPTKLGTLQPNIYWIWEKNINQKGLKFP